MKPFILIATIVLMVSVFLINTRTCSAEIVTLEVTGVVDSVSAWYGFALDGSVTVGSVMTGTCIYDTDATNLGGNINGVYTPISISMTIGNYVFTDYPTSSDSAFFIVYTVDPVYSIYSTDSVFDGTIMVNGSTKTYDEIDWFGKRSELINVWTSSSEYIPTSELPDSASFPDFSVFDRRREFDIGFSESGPYGERGGFSIEGELTSITAIPEPGTILLLGLGGLALLRKRKKYY